jgi:hypothetical protein
VFGRDCGRSCHGERVRRAPRPHDHRTNEDSATG